MADSFKYRRTIGKCRIAVVILSVALVAVIAAFAGVATHLHLSKQDSVATCPSSSKQINTDAPDDLPPFYDLTPEENAGVRRFLYLQGDLGLVKPSEMQLNTSYIYTIELHLPEKQSTLLFLDKGHEQRPREAKVIIFRGSKTVPDIEEYAVGPLPKPIYKNLLRERIPFSYRPLTAPEMAAAYDFLVYELHENIPHILQEAFGGKVKDCGNKCLVFKIVSAFPSSESGSMRTRKWWFWMNQDVEFPSLHPTDLQILIDTSGNSASQYAIDTVVLQGQTFKSLQELSTAYEENKITLKTIPFPDNNNDLFSSLHRRGSFLHDTDQRPPEQVEPDGARYAINGRHISYMGWDLDVRMSTITGPQLFDVRFNAERIAYEISLQEIAVFYSAHNPEVRFAAYTDTVCLIGMRARTLVPGADCPKHATFLSASHSYEGSDDLVVQKNSFCVFEQNTGTPLRRHLNPNGASGKSYEGVLDYVLVVRTIATVVNYDYTIDFIFHQNGGINVKAIPTGYILTSFWQPEEDQYGWRLRDHVTGNLHHHLLHFKVDLDIKGTKNRFETLDISETTVNNTGWSSMKDAKHSQTKFERKLVSTEAQAALQYDFNAPKYLTFYSNQNKTIHGVPKAYRLLMKGMSKQLIKPNMGQEPSVSWGRYQLAVTKRKENEYGSSSVYAIWDGVDPIVNFENYIRDDESIIDEDQVAWVTMGVHHIPHMEDFPVTHTVGLDLNFFLLPNNYFDEDPAMASRDAIRIDPKNQMNIKEGVTVTRYGKTENTMCAPPPSSFEEDVRNDPGIVFDNPAPGQV